MNYRIPHKVFILISVLLRGAVSLSSSFDGRNKNLTEIPTLDDLPATITSLDFSYNNIEVVHPITPQYPSSIKEVILSHNKIDTIVRGAFDNLINLENLDLSYNKITGSSLHIETSK
jgi:Leucine-rich repeat (LRR) protein